VAELLRPLRSPGPNVVYFTGVDLVNSDAIVIAGEAEGFREIEHAGVILVIESARFLSDETLKAAEKLADDLETRTLPIYVRQLG
jgi:thymidine kinase